MNNPGERKREMRVRSFLFALAACSTLGCWIPLTGSAQTAPSPAQKEAPAPLQAIEKALEAKRLELHVPGVAFAIVKDDRVIYSEEDSFDGKPGTARI